MSFENTAGFLSQELLNFMDLKIVLIPNWKWLALVGVFFLVIATNKIVRLVMLRLKKTYHFFRFKSFLHYFFQLEIEKALSWILSTLVGMIFIENLDLTINLEKYFLIVLKVLLSFNILRLLYCSAEALGSLVNDWAQQTHTQLDDQLAPLATKTLKGLILVIGTLVVLQNFGINVTALLAGLGLGGVALAFAAQDTVANVFGTITILLDAPFKIGDRIKISDIEGSVEEVGFRSTRIRTLHNSLITIPNSVIAKEKIDNLTERRGFCRLKHVFTFSYDHSIESIQLFTEKVQAYLIQDVRVIKEKIAVNISEFADSSINVTVLFHYRLQDSEDESLMTQRYLIDLFRITQELDLSLAYPTRTVLLKEASSSLTAK